MYCPNCGKELRDSSVKFCPDCGQRINGSETSQISQKIRQVQHIGGASFKLRRAMLIICVLFAIAAAIYIAITYDSYIEHYTVEGADAILCGVLVMISVITGIIGLCSKN